MKLKKDNVTKDIPDNLISYYLNMGWKKVEEEKKKEENSTSQSSILNQTSGNK